MNAQISKPAKPGPGPHPFRPRLLAGLALAAWVLMGLSCGPGDDPPGPGPDDPPPLYSDFSGTWEGHLFEATSGNFGEVILTAHQEGNQVSGTWTAIYPTVVNGGTMSGHASTGTTLHVVLDPADAYFCPIDVTVAVAGTAHVMGNYASVNCAYLQTGVIEAWRQSSGQPYNPQPPETPTGFNVTPGAGEVTLEWSHVDFASGYHVYWDTDAELDTVTAFKEERVTSPFVLDGLTNGQTYYFTVVADNMGGESTPATPLGATPQAP